MSSELPASHMKMHQLDGSRQQSSGLHGQKYPNSSVIRGGVPPYQGFRQCPEGDTAKEILKIFTFKAGMCMKTNKTMTKCPKRNGRFRLSFGHFRQTDTNFAEIRGEFTMKRRNLPITLNPRRALTSSPWPRILPGFVDRSCFQGDAGGRQDSSRGRA